MTVRQPRIEFVNLHEVAELLGVSSRTLYRMAKTKKMPFRRVGGRWLITRTQLETFFESPVPQDLLREVRDYRKAIKALESQKRQQTSSDERVRATG